MVLGTELRASNVLGHTPCSHVPSCPSEAVALRRTACVGRQFWRLQSMLSWPQLLGLRGGKQIWQRGCGGPHHASCGSQEAGGEGLETGVQSVTCVFRRGCLVRSRSGHASSFQPLVLPLAGDQAIGTCLHLLRWSKMLHDIIAFYIRNTWCRRGLWIALLTAVAFCLLTGNTVEKSHMSVIGVGRGSPRPAHWPITSAGTLGRSLTCVTRAERPLLSPALLSLILGNTQVRVDCWDCWYQGCS